MLHERALHGEQNSLCNWEILFIESLLTLYTIRVSSTKENYFGDNRRGFTSGGGNFKLVQLKNRYYD